MPEPEMTIHLDLRMLLRLHSLKGPSFSRQLSDREPTLISDLENALQKAGPALDVSKEVDRRGQTHYRVREYSNLAGMWVTEDKCYRILYHRLINASRGLVEIIPRPKKEIGLEERYDF